MLRKRQAVPEVPAKNCRPQEHILARIVRPAPRSEDKVRWRSFQLVRSDNRLRRHAAFLCRVACLRPLARPRAPCLLPLPTLRRNASIRSMTLLGFSADSGASIFFPAAFFLTSLRSALSYWSLNFLGSKCAALLSRICSASLSMSRGTRGLGISER